MLSLILLILIIPFIISFIFHKILKIKYFNTLSFNSFNIYIATFIVTLVFLNYRYQVNFSNFMSVFQRNRSIVELTLAILIFSFIFHLIQIVNFTIRKERIQIQIIENKSVSPVHSILMLLLALITTISFLSLNWFSAHFSFSSFEQLLFHANVEVIAKSNPDFFNNFLRSISILSVFFLPLFLILIVSLTSLTITIRRTNVKTLKEDLYFIKLKNVLFIYLLFSIISTSIHIYMELKIDQFLFNLNNRSLFIEENYVSPLTTELTFPDKKRNLIFIFLESMESTYFSKEYGGYMIENLIPNITELAIENQSFTSNKTPSAMHSVFGTEWTIASMVSKTSGIPLKIPIDGNSYGSDGSFLPGVTSIGDILKDQGYNQMLMVGSDSNFGGRRAYFQSHGDYQIFDHATAIRERFIPKNYFEWWGFEDEKLFEFAKEKITDLSNEEEPFNFTMLTSNTHHIDGFLSSECEPNFDIQYASVIYCSDNSLKQFIDWVKEQPFFENTSIVIVGDHLSMDPNFFRDINYDRQLINVFINSSSTTSNFNRQASVFDIFPTTLASLGVEIKGDRLGLGVNLFSNTPTLIETFSLNTLNRELALFSDFYNNKFILNIHQTNREQGE